MSERIHLEMKCTYLVHLTHLGFLCIIQSPLEFFVVGKRGSEWETTACVWCTSPPCMRMRVPAQSCLTLCNPTDCSPPGSSVRGILQAGILKWVAIAFSRGYFWPRDWTLVFAEKTFHLPLDWNILLYFMDAKNSTDNPPWSSVPIVNICCIYLPRVYSPLLLKNHFLYYSESVCFDYDSQLQW